MANYPQLDDCSGVWKLKDVNNAVSGGYWRVLTSTTGRALNAGGFVPGYSDVIEQIQIESSGNSTDFGNLSVAGGEMGAIGTPTRMVFLGRGIEASPNTSNIIDYVTIATAGNAADFGDMSGATQRTTGVGGNATRGVFTEGTTDLNGLQYITPSSTGNTITFGDMTVAGSFRSGVTSPTRVCYGEGFQPATSNVIDFVEIATTGNAVDFGDLTVARRGGSGLSSSTRGVFAGGIQPSVLSGLEFITIASQGNAIDYGDLANTNNKGCDSTSNSVRGIVAGGAPVQNIIQQFNIATGGNTTDFGDLLATVSDSALNSGSHGGLNDGYQGTRFANLPFGKITPIGVNVGNIGLFNGGEISAGTDVMDFINIASTGNATDWGNLSAANANGGATASETRYVTNGNNTASLDMNYVEFASKGNTALFGDLTVRRHLGGTGGNKTRGIMYSGQNPDNDRGDTADGACNVIDYITYATLGNATDFGDANVASYFAGGCSSATRTLKFGGIAEAPGTLTNSIEFVSTASTGNGADFGNLLAANESPTLGPISSSTRGVVAGGKAPGIVNVIQYVTLASEGDATDFGDLTAARAQPGGACSATRGTFAGGEEPAVSTRIDFVTIATTANAADFGDLTITVSRHGGNSNGNGGLS